MFSIEHKIAAYFPVEKELSAGVRAALGNAMVELPYAVPQLLIYQDPVPNGVVVRGIGSPGTVLLSQGLIQSFREEEFYLVLRECVERLNAPGIRFRSACSCAAAFFIHAMPRSWIELIWGISNKNNQKLGFFSGLYTLMLLGFSRLFIFLTRLSKSSRKEHEKTAALQQFFPYADFALLTGNPGLAPLYLVDPWSKKFF